MRRFLFLFAAFALAAPAVAAQGLVFRDSVCNIGAITENDAPKVYTFHYENSSQKPVVILRVTTTCGCVKPTFPRQPVAPGARGEVRVTLDPHGRAGALYKVLQVYTSDSGRRPAARIALTGVVKSSSGQPVSPDAPAVSGR